MKNVSRSIFQRENVNPLVKITGVLINDFTLTLVPLCFVVNKHAKTVNRIQISELAGLQDNMLPIHW